MKKRVQKMMKNEKGLTLVELLAVIVILGIIAAIAIPAIGNIIQNSKIKAVKADAQNTLAAANMYFIENDGKDGIVTITDLIKDGFLQDAGSLAEAGKVTKKVATAAETDKGGNIIIATGTNGKVVVEFKSATSKMISDSGNSLTVSTGTPGG